MTLDQVKKNAVVWHSFRDLAPRFRRTLPVDRVRVVQIDRRKKRQPVYVTGIDAPFGMWVSPVCLTRGKPRQEKNRDAATAGR